MRYYGFSVNTGVENMRIDSEILENAVQNMEKEPIFRLYGWEPKCISLGRNQKADFLKDDIDCVRRLTGGRALLHDDEITYSFVSPVDVIPNGQTIVESYKYISGILIDFLKIITI